MVEAETPARSAERQEAGPQIALTLIESELPSNMVSVTIDRVHCHVEEPCDLLGGLALFSEKHHLHFFGRKIERRYLLAEWG